MHNYLVTRTLITSIRYSVMGYLRRVRLLTTYARAKTVPFHWPSPLCLSTEGWSGCLAGSTADMASVIRLAGKIP
jgi:hypothetical protein